MSLASVGRKLSFSRSITGRQFVQTRCMVVGVGDGGRGGDLTVRSALTPTHLSVIVEPGVDLNVQTCETLEL